MIIFLWVLIGLVCGFIISYREQKLTILHVIMYVVCGPIIGLLLLLHLYPNLLDRCLDFLGKNWFDK